MDKKVRKLLLFLFATVCVIALGVWLALDYGRYLSDEQLRRTLQAQGLSLYSVQSAHREVDIVYASTIASNNPLAMDQLARARADWQQAMENALKLAAHDVAMQQAITALAQEASAHFDREIRLLDGATRNGVTPESWILGSNISYGPLIAVIQRQEEAIELLQREKVQCIFSIGMTLVIVLFCLLGATLYAMNFANLKLRFLERQLKEETMYDKQTGLANRPYLEDWLKAQISSASRMGDSFNLMVLSLDGLEHINLNYGPEVEDSLLQTIAQKLSKNLRAGDFTAHISANEFAVVFSCEPDSREVGRFAERLIRYLQKPLVPEVPAGMVSVSIGMANYPTDGSTPNALLESALIAVRQAQHAGSAAYAYKLERSQREQPSVWEVSRF